MRHSSIRFSSLFVVLTTLSQSTKLSLAQEPVDAANQCSCGFDMYTNNCYMYGPDPAGGSDLVAYPKASELCLQSIGAQNDYLSELEFSIMCPFANHTDFNLEQFLVLMRQDTDTEAAQYAISQFVENMSFDLFEIKPSGKYGLVDVLTNNRGNQFNCTTELAQCWNQVKSDIKGRYPRFGLACQEFHRRMIPALYEEQATARRLLCEGSNFTEDALKHCEKLKDVVAGTSNCAALTNQVSAEESGIPQCGKNVDPAPAPSSSLRSEASMGSAFLLVFVGLAFW